MAVASAEIASIRALRLFCDDCREWCAREPNAIVLPGAATTPLVEAIVADDPSRIAALRDHPADDNELDKVIASLHYCPHCDQTFADVSHFVHDGKNTKVSVLLKQVRISPEMAAACWAHHDPSDESEPYQPAPGIVEEPPADDTGMNWSPGGPIAKLELGRFSSFYAREDHVNFCLLSRICGCVSAREARPGCAAEPVLPPSRVRNPYDFLVTNFTLLLRPSTAPEETSPRGPEPVQDQAADDSRIVRATFFIGSSRDRITRRVHSSRNLPAHDALLYSQNRWNSSRSKYARTVRRLYFNNSDSFTVCLSVRFSGRFKKHHRDFFSTGS